MTLLELIKGIKIDLTESHIEPDSGSVLDHTFDISPKDFLSYSKQDFKLNDRRGNINALTNAKRAIDCQTDKIFFSLGLDPNDFPKVIEEFVSKSKKSPSKKDLPIRLKFLQSMNFAPAEIIANARLLRNKLEHYYKKPTNQEVSNAIELAELFILATDSKLKSMWDFSITDEKKYAESDGHLWNSIYVTFDYKKHHFNLNAYFGKDRTKKIIVKNTSIEFYFLLKIATSFDYNEDVQEAFSDLVENIGHPIPRQNINVSVG